MEKSLLHFSLNFPKFSMSDVHKALRSRAVLPASTAAEKFDNTPHG